MLTANSLLLSRCNTKTTYASPSNRDWIVEYVFTIVIISYRVRSWDIYLSERYCYSTSFVTSHRKSLNRDTQCVESIFLEPQSSKVRCFEQFSIIFRVVDMKYPSIFLVCLAIVGSVWGMPQGGGSDPCTPNPCGDNSLCKANGNAGAIACYCQPGDFTKTNYQFQLENFITIQILKVSEESMGY